jgi:hypothetical protein
MPAEFIPFVSDWLNAVLSTKQQLSLFHIVVGLTFLIWVARPILAAATKAADTTATKLDNKALQVASTILDWIGILLDVLRRVTPHISMGPLPMREPITTRTSRRPSLPVAEFPPSMEQTPAPMSVMGLVRAAPIGSNRPPPPGFGELNQPIVDYPASDEITRRERLKKPPTL